MKNYKKVNKHEKNLILIKIFHSIKSKIPNNIVFWFLFCILKFLGPLIIVNNYNNTNSEFINIIRNLVFYKGFEVENYANAYNIFSILIYFFVSFPIILVYYVYNQKVKTRDQENSLLKLTARQKSLIKIASIIFLIILIFSQHLVEILSISIVQTYIFFLNNISNTFNVNAFRSAIVYSNVINFSNNILLTTIPALVLNMFFIVLINMITFLFIKYSNDITCCLNSRLKMQNSNYLYVTITLIGNLQGFHYYDLIFNDSTIKIKLVFLIISLLILVYPCIYLLLDLIYKSFVGQLLMILQLICIFSGLLNIVFSDLENSVFLIFLKFFFSSSIAFLIFNNIEKKSYEKISSKLKKNFFEDNKRISMKLLLFIIENLTSETKIVSNLYFFMELIHSHKQVCKFKKCNCNKYPLFTDIENIELKNAQEICEMQSMITEVIENELFGSIISTNSEAFKANKEFCLLHIDFVYNVKKTEMLAYYLIDIYTNGFYEPKKLNTSTSNISNEIPTFYILYKLYEYKKIILKTSFLKKKYKQIRHYNNLNYLHDLDYLKKSIFKNFTNYEKLFGLKQNILNNFLYESKLKKNTFGAHRYDLNQAKLNNKTYNFEDIVDLCEELANDYRNMKKYLKSKYSSSPLRNAEIGYLIYNFFQLFNKKIPFSVRSCFSIYEKYEYLLSLETVYKEIETRHPIIIKIDTKMNFIIKYISQKLCDLIFYEKKELLEKDMHCLLPDNFVNIHSKIVKNFIFMEKQQKLLMEAFLVTRRSHYFPFNLNANIFPSLDYNLNILIDLKPIKTYNDGCFDEYYFILDRKMNTICFSKTFEDKYSLTLEFFKRLKLNFCDLFGINNLLLNTNFEEEIGNIQNNDYAYLFTEDSNENTNSGFNNSNNNNSNNNKSHKNINDICSRLAPSEKAGENYLNAIVNISKNKNPIKEMIDKSNKILKKERPQNSEYSIRGGGRFVEYSIKKEKLIPSINKLKNSIYEKESDKDLYDKLVQFEKKVTHRMTDFNFFERQQSLLTLTNIFRGSTIVKNQKKKGKMDLFTIIFNIGSIGNMPYYIIKVIDLELPTIISNTFLTNSLNLTINQIQKHLQLKNSNSVVPKDIDFPTNLPEEIKRQFNTISQLQRSNNSMLNLNAYTNTNKDDSMTSDKNIINNTLNNSFGSISFNNKENKDSNAIFSSNRSFIGNQTFGINNNQPSKFNNKNIEGSSNNININQNEKDSNVNLPHIGTNYTSYSQMMNNLSLNFNNSKLLLNQPQGLLENENTKKLNFENLNNNIYTKITNNNNTTQGNTGSKKNLKNFKSQNLKRSKMIFGRNNFKGKFLTSFYLLLLILLITLICDYPLKISTLSFSHKLSEINYYILGMKSEVFATASAIITACTRIDGIDSAYINGFDNTINKIKEIIGQRANDLNSFTYRFFSYLDDINYEGINQLFSIINREDNYNFLYSDWTNYRRNSTFITQLKNFNYLASFMKKNNQFNNCRVRERFFNRNFIYDYTNSEASQNAIFLTKEELKKINENKDNYNSKVFSEEMILFYVFENIITTYKNNLLQLTLISNTILENYHRSAATYIIIYNSANLALIVACFVMMIYFIILKKNKVMGTFLKLFTNKNNDKFFEMKVINFKGILNSFDQNYCLEYEKKKTEIIALEEKVLSEVVEAEELLKKEPNLLVKGKKIKGKIPGYVVPPALGLLRNKDKLTLRSHNDILSLNSSMRKLDKDKEWDMDIVNNLDIYSSDFLDQVRFDHLDLKVYNFGKILLVIGGLILIILNIINLIENSAKFDNLIKGNLISANFLERMPKFCELILYYKISIIYKDVFFIKTDNKIENSHLNYYNVTVDISKEGIFKSLKDSQFSNIYYQFLIIEANLKTFMNELKDENILENIRVLEKNLNTKDFCFYLAKSYTELANTYEINNFKAGFELMNQYALECRQIGNGINGNPLTAILDNILMILKNNYFDFLKSDDKNITKFVGSTDVIRANLEIEYIFKKIHDSIMFMIKADIDTMYSNTLNTEISFSTAFIVVYLIYILIFLVYVVRKLERYNSNLSFTLERFKKALMKR